jgi:hypothetical protein
MPDTQRIIEIYHIEILITIETACDNHMVVKRREKSQFLTPSMNFEKNPINLESTLLENRHGAIKAEKNSCFFPLSVLCQTIFIIFSFIRFFISILFEFIHKMRCTKVFRLPTVFTTFFYCGYCTKIPYSHTFFFSFP